MMDGKLISLVVMILVQAAGVVWWSASLSASVQHNNYQIKMITRDVEKNSTFVELWPAGKWGSGELPSDTRQDLKIERLEKQIESIIDKVYGNGP